MLQDTFSRTKRIMGCGGLRIFHGEKEIWKWK